MSFTKKAFWYIELLFCRQPGQNAFPVVEKKHMGFRLDGKAAVPDAVDNNHGGKPLVYGEDKIPIISYQTGRILSRENVSQKITPAPHDFSRPLDFLRRLCYNTRRM